MKKAYPRDDAQQGDGAESQTEPAPRMNLGTPQSKPKRVTRPESSQSPLKEYPTMVPLYPATDRLPVSSMRDAREPRDALPLEFFDEEDNNPLPNTYTHGGFAFPSPSYGYFRPEYAHFDSLYSTSPMTPQMPSGDGRDGAPYFFTPTEEFNAFEEDWNLNPRPLYNPPFLFDGRGTVGAVRGFEVESRRSPPQLDSFSGEQSRTLLSHHDSLLSSRTNRGGYYPSSMEPTSQRDVSLFDSMGSQSPTMLVTQRDLPKRYSGLFGEDVEDAIPARQFFSNGGHLSGDEHKDYDEMPLFQSAHGFDEDAHFDFSAAPTHSSFMWSRFDDHNGEEIDSMM